MIPYTRLTMYDKYTNSLLCREHETNAVITRAHDNFAFHPQRSTEDGSPVSFMLLQQRTRPRIPRSEHLVCRRGDDNMPFCRMCEEVGHSVLVIQVMSFQHFT